MAEPTHIPPVWVEQVTLTVNGGLGVAFLTLRSPCPMPDGSVEETIVGRFALPVVLLPVLRDLANDSMTAAATLSADESKPM